MGESPDQLVQLGRVARLLTGYWAAGVLLILFWIMAITAWQGKCTTFDEREYLAAGLGWWHTGDMRFIGDDCIVPKIWGAMPTALGPYNMPAPDSAVWANPLAAPFSEQTFYQSGNDAGRILWRGRAVTGLVTVLTGLIVYGWSRRLFGRVGGIISLLIFVFCPLMLSHGVIATSDAWGALCFLAAIGSLWLLLQRVTWWTIFLSSAVVGMFFITKLTAFTIIPVGLTMAAIRIWNGAPLPVELMGKRLIKERGKQAAIFAGLLAVHVFVAGVIIWIAFGFQASPFSEQALTAELAARTQIYEQIWHDSLPQQGMFRNVILFARGHHLLPDRYLLGVSIVNEQVGFHPSFAAGQYSNNGFWWFFPYAMAVKTPLGIFLVLLLALLASVTQAQASGAKGHELFRRITEKFYRTAPLWIGLAIYVLIAMRTTLNIGVRHLLPIYPILFILTGGAGYWVLNRRGICTAALAAALLWVVAASLWVRPNYLAYFNEVAGGPANGYRCLVDSSLDWGQDLPGLKDYLAKNNWNNDSKVPVYLSYFGTGDPAYYGINATLLPCYFPQAREEHSILPLRAGVYCVSATMLAGTYITPGGWNAVYEKRYQDTVGALQQLQHLDEHPELAKRFTPEQRAQIAASLVNDLRITCTGRLFAYLRHREPDDNVSYSILIYKLTDDEIAKALGGPPAELLDTDALAPKQAQP